MPTVPDKNLHASVPPALLTKAQQAAEDEHMSIDQFVADAIERRLRSRELAETLTFGRQHARQRGLKPGDIAAAVTADRGARKERER